jgi:hypothetical protein
MTERLCIPAVSLRKAGSGDCATNRCPLRLPNLSLAQLFPRAVFFIPLLETSRAPVNHVFNDTDVSHKMNIKTTFTSSRLIEKTSLSRYKHMYRFTQNVVHRDSIFRT